MRSYVFNLYSCHFMCIKSEQFIHWLVGGSTVPSVPKDRQDRLPSDAGSCYDASASLNSNNSNSLQVLDSAHWKLGPSQEDLAERSNISEFFIAGNQHPCRCRVVRVSPLPELPVQLKPSTVPRSGTQWMLRHDCMVATCLPKGWFCQVSVGLVSRCVVHQHGTGVQLHLDPTCWTFRCSTHWCYMLLSETMWETCNWQQ